MTFFPWRTYTIQLLNSPCAFVDWLYKEIEFNDPWWVVILMQTWKLMTIKRNRRCKVFNTNYLDSYTEKHQFSYYVCAMCNQNTPKGTISTVVTSETSQTMETIKTTDDESTKRKKKTLTFIQDSYLIWKLSGSIKSDMRGRGKKRSQEKLKFPYQRNRRMIN